MERQDAPRAIPGSVGACFTDDFEVANDGILQHPIGLKSVVVATVDVHGDPVSRVENVSEPQHVTLVHSGFASASTLPRM